MATVCINPGCGRTDDLTTASLSMKRFFGVKRHCVGQSEGVCSDCMELYDQNLKEQQPRVKTRNPVLQSLLLGPPSPGAEEIIEEEKGTDSAEEKVTDPDVMEVDSEDELVFEFDEDLDLDDVITTNLDRFDFHLQVKNAKLALDTSLKKMQPDFDETDDLFEKLEEQAEQLKADLEQLAGLDTAPSYETEEVELVDNALGLTDVQRPMFGIANANAATFAAYHAQKQQGSNDNSAKWNNSNNKIDSDVIPVGRVNAPPRPALPPIGPITRRELQLGMRVYAMKASYFGIWYKARVVETKTGQPGEGTQYKVRFEPKRMAAHTRILSGKHLAYVDSANVILPVGTRIIAQYKDEYWNQANSMYAGIIAEPPKIMNQYRYLVFFDDGYAQYITHSQIHLVCEVSKDVWDDIHPDSKEFIRSYLQQYPERPMVKLQQGQVVKTEWNGKWWIARVVEVDASLVKMYFDADKRTEWIYRGSTRLGPLYSELANAEANKATGKLKRHNLGMSKRKNGPYVEYTRGLDDPERAEVGEPVEAEEPEAATPSAGAEAEEPPAELATSESPAVVAVDSDEENSQQEKRQVAKKHTAPAVPSPPLQRPNVAKKSTGGSANQQSNQQSAAAAPPARPVVNRHVPHPESDGVYEPRYSQHVEYRKRFVPHRCSSSCLATASDHPSPMKGKNPLLIPMLFGWERQMAKYQTAGKRSVLYRAPCGRRLRCLEEVHTYLLATLSKLSIDLFCFDVVVHCFGEFVPSRAFCFIKDISYGKENVPVTCVNSINRQYPEYVEYSTRRLPAKGVHLNLESEFLVGCDCTDDCSDPSKCLCQQLTQTAASEYSAYYNGVVGYKHRRLTENILTGIYECNSRCKCRSQCLNRVVQNGLQLRLQVFKTELRGWGLRCLDDVPHGCFICIYAGQLLTDEGANEDGVQYGDEYLAELDYIEVVEKLKEGYESDIVDDDQMCEKKDEEKEAASELSEEEHGSDDEEGFKSDSSHNRDQEENSSDSDFEMSRMRPVVPREKSSRKTQKVEKLNIHKEKKRKRRKRRQSSDKSSTKDDEPTSAKSNPEEDAGFIRDFLRNIPDLSPTTLEEMSHSRLIRKPRMSRGMSENSSHLSDSDTEDASKASSITTTGDTADTEVDEKNTRHPSRFNILPDPKKQDRTEPVSPPATKGPIDEKAPVKFQSVRRYFGEEYCYIMDAKSIGNIGRYLNHSCAPNVFVQNVFVDTHDLRFPWVAFFSMQYIRAGTELTWDYNYDVGSVPGKVLYCHCTAADCRGRLL